MAKRLAVVISQSQSSNPAKRQLEEDIVLGLLTEPGIDVTIVPHLYDLLPESTGHLALRSISGNLVVLSWLFERAARWTLDRHGIQGQVGTVLLTGPDDEDEDEDDEEDEEDNQEGAEAGNGKLHVVDQRPPSPRFIYCLDLKVSNRAQEYLDEIRRIHQENRVEIIPQTSSSLPMVSAPAPMANRAAAEPRPATMDDLLAPSAAAALAPAATVQRIESDTGRRWYPVIDYSRCTNCMECIDFCLFGVYGVDPMETILVEQPDNCRKGCPACSRVCPENAIMFPQHKTPAIAGSNEAAASMKIDLSQLFGAPTEGKSALEVAAAERDEQLLMAGRDAVGLNVGVPKRQAEKTSEPRNRLDDLVDELDSLDL